MTDEVPLPRSAAVGTVGNEHLRGKDWQVKPRYLFWYLAALAAMAIGAVALDAPASTILLGLILLACPLAMMFMMGGMGGAGHGSGHDGTNTHDQHDSAQQS